MDQETVKAAADGLIEIGAEQAAAAIRQYQLRASGEETPEDSTPPSVALGAFLDKEPEVPPILVKPALVVRGGTTITVGRAGKGKTMMNLNRLMSWSAGRSYFEGYEAMGVDQPLKCLIIENEGAAVMFHRKVGRMFQHSDFTHEQQALARENFFVWGDGGYSGLKIDSDEGLLKLRKECDRLRPDIVFIEPLRFLFTGEENSATEMANVLDRLVGVASEFECGIILSHHERKGGMSEDDEAMSLARGSTAIEGAVDVMENFKSAKGGDFRELSWSKSRYEEKPESMRLQWNHTTHWYTLIPPSKGSEEILRCLTNAGAALTVKQISEEVEETEARTRRELTKMLDETPPRIERYNVQGEGYMYRPCGNESDDGRIDF